MFKRILAIAVAVLLITAPCFGAVEIQDDGTPVGIVNSINFAGSTVTLSGSVASVTLNDIDSGTIDGTVIGGTTPAAGTFSTLTANTSLTLDGVTITSFGGVISPWTDAGATTTLNAAPAGFVATHGTGSFKATQIECGSGDLLFENAQVIDGGTDDYIKFIENDELWFYFDGTDATILASNGGVIFDLNQADGDVEFRTRNDDNDYFQFYTAANIPTIATPAGDDGDIAIIPGGGAVAITGDLDVSGTITGTFAITSITMGDDILSRPADDILRWTSNDEHATIEAYGFTAKDGRLLLTSNASAVAGDEYRIEADGEGSQSLIIFNDISGAHAAIWQMSTAGDITMEGDVITLGDDEYISNAVDGTVLIATNTEDAILRVYSANATDGDATLALQGDAAGAVHSRWDIITDTGADTLIFKSDSAIVDTMVTKLTIDSADGDILTIGDLAIIENMDLILGAAGGTDWKVQFNDAVDDQLVFSTALLTAIVDTDPMFEIRADSGTAAGASIDAEQEIFGVAVGTQDNNLSLFTVDAEGDAIMLGDLTVTGQDIQLGSATGVKITSDNDGAITFLGTGAGADEDLTINLDDTANEITLSTSTLATLVNLSGALDLQVMGGQFTMQSATASEPVIWLENIADDATAPSIVLENDRAAQADGDDCGTLIFRASDDAGTQNDVVTIIAYIEEVADANEAGTLEIKVMHDDGTPALDSFVVLSGDNGTPGQGEIVFNEDSKDINFSIETDTTDDFLWVDSGADFVSINGPAAYAGDNYIEIATTPNFQVNTTADDGGIAVNTWTTTATEGGGLFFNTADHATIGTHGALEDGDLIGGIYFNPSDSAAFQSGAAIVAIAGAQCAAGDTPADLLFYTTPDGTDTPVLAMTIDDAGLVTVASDVVVSGGDLTMASATSSKPVLWLENTNDDGTCAIIQLENDEATPADGDDLGIIKFIGSDSGLVAADYVTILAEANEINATDDAGKLSISALINDVDTPFIDLFGDTTGATTGHININASANDIDFHIDGANQADLFLIDAGTDTIDMDLAQTTSRLLVTTGAAGTATKSLIFVDDNRTGATADTKEEASLEIDPEGTHAIHVVDGISHFGGECNFAAGQTRKVWLGIGGVAAGANASSVVLDSTKPPAVGVTGTAVQAEFVALKFDANPDTTGDDSVYIHWKVPDGYKTDTAKLNIHYIGPAGEVAGDDIVFGGTVNAIASGEGLDAAGTGMTLVTDEQTTAVGGEYFIAQLDLEVEEIVVDDLVTIWFFVDEDSCELAVAGTADIFGFEIEYESTE